MSPLTPSFRLPDFLRSTWASDAAREVWKPRLEAIRDAWPRVAIARAAAGETACSIRTLPSRMIFSLQAEASRRGVTAMVLGVQGVAVAAYASDTSFPTHGRPFLYTVAFGAEEACREMEAVWESGEVAGAYRMAGLPGCCLAALERDVAMRRVDPVGRYVEAEGSTEFDDCALSDPFWSWMNVAPVSLAPCGLRCKVALAQREAWMVMAIQFGYEREMAWLREVLSWPVEWTALHGIAELKTPIAKVLWTSDATAGKLTVRVRGRCYPAEGATGLGFPYRAAKNAPLTSSAAFTRGINNLISIANQTTA